ncbi:MAG: PBP1A family penicillin-binding protein [Desulfurispora sp.]
MPGRLMVYRRLVLVALLTVLMCTAAFTYTFWFLGRPTDARAVARNSFIYDAQGNVLYELHGEINRVPVELEQIPLPVRQAFIAIEDERFYQHPGVDIKAIFRALVGNITARRIAQGGSTITQQVIKTYYLSPERTFSRKLKEIFLALSFERTHSKDEILEMYLNRIYLGEGAYGVQAAARSYFNKDVGQLTLAQGALLAGLTRAPSLYDPYVNPDLALQRRNTVLSKMLEQGLIDREQYNQALAEPLNLQRPEKNQQSQKYAFYIDQVISEAIARLKDMGGDDLVFNGGLQIKTAFEPALQEAAEEAFARAGFADNLMQGALVLVDNRTGAIKAVIGGRQHEARLGFNRATSLRRQPGSTFKPLAVYGPAFEMGYGPGSLIKDIPQRYGDGYAPRNADGSYYGDIPITVAVQWSRNAAAVWLLNEIGVERGMEFARRLGIDLVPEDAHLPLALGGLTRGVSPLQMAGAYAAFANGGLYCEPHAIEQIIDAQGNILYQAPVPRRVMQQSTAEKMTDVLQNAVRAGTGRRAYVPGVLVAGKTGTTELPKTAVFRGLSGNKDAWFVGYTDRFTCAVWVGYDEKDMDRSHYLRFYGGGLPASIFHDLIFRIYKPEEPITRDSEPPSAQPSGGNGQLLPPEGNPAAAGDLPVPGEQDAGGDAQELEENSVNNGSTPVDGGMAPGNVQPESSAPEVTTPVTGDQAGSPAGVPAPSRPQPPAGTTGGDKWPVP